MRDLKILRQYWSNHQGEPLVLCTIVGKEGSGYRNLGAKKIITKDGNACGFLSGGCLEGEIVRHALDNWESAPFLYSFSTMSEEDRLMGYQTGCAGTIDILFEKLPPELRLDDFFPYGENKKAAGISISLSAENLGERKFEERPPQKNNKDVYFDRWQRPVHLYVIGCGPNTHPFAELAPPLGWQVTFIDYRKEYTLPESADIKSLVIDMPRIGEAIPEQDNVAVVLATHNYEADLQIMSQLNGKNFGYLGCIGPRKRFDSMKEDLKKFYNVHMDETWTNKVKAPAGLHQAWNPEDIAFSIMAEIQFGLGKDNE